MTTAEQEQFLLLLQKAHENISRKKHPGNIRLTDMN